MSAPKIALFSTAYMPPVSFFATALQYELIFIEACENYPKQSYRNRCRILGPNGMQTLSIPTLKTAELKRQTKDVCIAYNDRWQQIHWRSILTAYSKSPYFLYYRDAFEPFFEKQYPLLMELNQQLMALIFKLLKLNCQLAYTTQYGEHDLVDHDYRTAFTPKKEIEIMMPPYYQVFRERAAFIPDLSILDLLFNLGPEAAAYLHSLELPKKEIPLPEN